MKKLFLISILLFLSSLNILKAEMNILFVDMNKIMSTSKSGSSLLKQLTKLNNKNSNYFKNQEKLFKDKEEKIIKKKNIISEIELKASIDKLRSEIANYNKNKNQMITEFSQLKINNTNKLLKLINPILISYSDKESISMILQKKDLIIGKAELDITDKIIKIVDENIKEFKIK